MISMSRAGLARPSAEAPLSAAILGTAAALSVAGLIVLIGRALEARSGWPVSSVSIYGATLVFAYLSAALYHGARRKRARAVFQTFDHCAIFLLIAGTYTPFALLVLGDHLGWLLLALVWLLAFAGIGIRVFWIRRLHRFAPALYVVMGWLGLLWAGPLLDTVGAGALALIVAGGIAYTAGLAFFRWHGLRYGNALWHLFVVAGSACHFSAIALYVLPYGNRFSG